MHLRFFTTTKILKVNDNLSNRTEFFQFTHSTKFRLKVLETEEVSVGFVKEVLDVVVSRHSTMFLKRGEELLLGGLIMVDTEFTLKDKFKLLLSFSEEIILTSNIFLLKTINLGFPWLEFSFILSNLELEFTKYFESACKSICEFIPGFFDVFALSFNLKTCLWNELRKTSMKISDLQLVGFHQRQVISQFSHSQSQVCDCPK